MAPSLSHTRSSSPSSWWSPQTLLARYCPTQHVTNAVNVSHPYKQSFDSLHTCSDGRNRHKHGTLAGFPVGGCSTCLIDAMGSVGGSKGCLGGAGAAGEQLPLRVPQPAVGGGGALRGVHVPGHPRRQAPHRARRLAALLLLRQVSACSMPPCII